MAGAGWAAAGQAAAGIAGGLISNIGNSKRQKRAFKQEQKMMGIQFENQKALNQQGHELQKKMWEETNYPAQMGMLKEAGLNPALMYGMSGGGGTTTGSQGGGSAASGHAPAPIPMDIGNAIQAAMAASTIELQKSQANKNDAEANSISGGEGTIGASTIKANEANALNQQTDAKVKQLGYEIGQATKEDQIDKVHFEVENLISQNNLNEAQAEQARQQAVTLGVQAQLHRANIQVAEGTVQKMVAEIKQGWQKLDNELQSLGILNQGNKLRAIDGKTRLTEIQADFALGVLGKNIDLMKLNVEQQKVFTSIFQSLFIGGAVAKQLEPARTQVKGFK